MGAPTLGDADHIFALAAAGHVYIYSGKDRDAVKARATFRVGPHARLPFTAQEREDGIAGIPANAVSMFRTASKTAGLAATFSALTQD